MCTRRARGLGGALILLHLGAFACQAPQAENRQAPVAAWTTLCDGKSLSQFAETSFGGEGEVWVEDGAVHLGFGSPLTGIHWTGVVAHEEYELEVEAARLDGDDFFCGLTFPVGDSHCTLVCGGWGGSLTGLSNIDGLDASDNATQRWVRYETGRFYRIRVAVSDDAIRTFLDGEPLVSHARPGHHIDLRPEVLPCRPLGIASFATHAVIRSVRVRSTSTTGPRRP